MVSNGLELHEKPRKTIKKKFGDWDLSRGNLVSRSSGGYLRGDRVQAEPAPSRIRPTAECDWGHSESVPCRLGGYLRGDRGHDFPKLQNMFWGPKTRKNFIVPEGSWVRGMTEKMGLGNFFKTGSASVFRMMWRVKKCKKNFSLFGALLHLLGV